MAKPCWQRYASAVFEKQLSDGQDTAVADRRNARDGLLVRRTCQRYRYLTYSSAATARVKVNRVTLPSGYRHGLLLLACHIIIFTAAFPYAKLRFAILASLPPWLLVRSQERRMSLQSVRQFLADHAPGY